jgi:DNA-directed RNA polymerase subunit RPC12/RpoP
MTNEISTEQYDIPNKVVMDNPDLHIEATPGHVTIKSNQNWDIDKFVEQAQDVQDAMTGSATTKHVRISGDSIIAAVKELSTRKPATDTRVKCSKCGATFSHDMARNMYMCIFCGGQFHAIVEIAVNQEAATPLSISTKLQPGETPDELADRHIAKLKGS